MRIKTFLLAFVTVTYAFCNRLAEFGGSNTRNRVKVDRDFLPVLRSLNEIAQICNVKIHFTQGIRYEGQKVRGAPKSLYFKTGEKTNYIWV